MREIVNNQEISLKTKTRDEQTNLLHLISHSYIAMEVWFLSAKSSETNVVLHQEQIKNKDSEVKNVKTERFRVFFFIKIKCLFLLISLTWKFWKL